MRRSKITLALALGVFLLGMATVAAAPKKKSRATVTCYQDAEQVESVESGSTFEIRGEGLATWSPIWVCITFYPCNRIEMSEHDGSFAVSRNDIQVTAPRTFEITVYQWKNPGKKPELRRSEAVAVESMLVYP